MTRPTLYRWIKDYEQDGAGLAGLMDKESSQKGKRFITVTRNWDEFFSPHISPEDHQAVGDALTHYIRSLWASGARGKYAVSEQATTRLSGRHGQGRVSFSFCRWPMRLDRVSGVV